MNEVSTWEVQATVTVTLEREGEDNDPSTRESMEMDRAIQQALEDAAPSEIDGWTVEDWKVETR